MNNVIQFKPRDFNVEYFNITREHGQVMAADYVKVFLYNADLFPHLPNEELRNSVLSLSKSFNLERQYQTCIK